MMVFFYSIRSYLEPQNPQNHRVVGDFLWGFLEACFCVFWKKEGHSLSFFVMIFEGFVVKI